MKFRFCADLDCQDWILAEIGTISKISSIKAKQLASLVAIGLISKEKLPSEKLAKLAADAKFELKDIDACSALIEFVLVNAAKNSVNAETLSNELQQLGLPKEHSGSFCKVYEDNQLKLEQMLRESSLRLNKLQNCSYRIDYVLGSSNIQELGQPLIHLQLKYKNFSNEKLQNHVVSLDSTKLNLLIQELKDAKKIMDSVEF